MGAAIEVIDQKLIQKKESIDWKAVAYEAVVGGVGAAIGGIGQSVAKMAATKTAAKVTAKTVAKAAAKTIALEAAGGFIADVGRQVYVDGKAPEEVDYGQAIKTAAVAGTAGAIGYAGEQVVKKAGSQLATNVTKHVDKAVDSVDNQIVRSVPSNQVSASTAGNHVPVSSTSANKAASITTNSIDDVVPSRSVGAESTVKRSYQDGVDKAVADNAKARTLAVESGSKSPSEIARSWQGSGKYPGIDEYTDITVNKGSILYRGEPNGTEYFTTLDAIESSGRNATTIFEGLQVEKNPIHGYRGEMQGYLFNEDVVSAYGITRANPQFGKGGLPQYFVPNVQDMINRGALTPVDKIKLFK